MNEEILRKYTTDRTSSRRSTLEDANLTVLNPGNLLTWGLWVFVCFLTELGVEVIQ